MLLTMYQIYSLNESRNILNFALINEIIKISFGQTFWKFVGFYRLFMEVCRHLHFEYHSITIYINIIHTKYNEVSHADWNSLIAKFA